LDQPANQEIDCDIGQGLSHGYPLPPVLQPGEFEPEKFEDHYEAALAELINAKRNGKTVGVKPRPKGENVVDLMEALKRSIGDEAQATKGNKPRKATAGQKEMLLPISGKRAAKQDAKKSDKPATARTRKRA
jgi:DNA end-binding protein Ku